MEPHIGLKAWDDRVVNCSYGYVVDTDETQVTFNVTCGVDTQWLVNHSCIGKMFILCFLLPVSYSCLIAKTILHLMMIAIIYNKKF